MWRREHFEWEANLVSELVLVLARETLSRENSNKRIWSYQNSRVFSTKSFLDVVIELKSRERSSYNYATKVLCKVAPPKVKLLV